MRFVRSMCGIALVAVLAGCTDGPAAAPSNPAPPNPAVSGSAASASGPAPVWNEPADYGFVVDRQCEGRPSLGKYRVQVTARQVVSVERVDGKTASGEEEIEVPSLGGMLDLAQTAAEDGGATTVKADPADGHPTLISFDVSEGSDAAGGTCFVITEYAPGE